MIADQLVELLHRDLVRKPDMVNGVFATEVAAPYDNRRADVIWLGLSQSASKELVGFEIKVSRADLRSELAEPEKAEAWTNYCDRWWLVVPDARLLRGFDIPEWWGVLTPPAGRCTRKMTVTRPAPPLHPRDPVAGVRALTTWLAYRHADLQRVQSSNGQAAAR